MAKKSLFLPYVLELLAPQDGISARAMFGGHGIYRNGVMFALIASDTLYLKVDATNQADFEHAGSRPFVYQSKNRAKPVQMSYWEAPPAALERSEVMCQWAAGAQAAATRAQKTKGAKAKRPRRKSG